MASPPPPGGPVSGPISNLPLDLFNLIPGGNEVLSLIKIVTSLVDDIEKGVQAVQSLHPVAILGQAVQGIRQWPNFLNFLAHQGWDDLANMTFGGFVTSFIDLGLGVDTSQLDPQAQASLTTIDTVLSFCLVVQALAAGLSGAGEGILANRWGKGIHEAVSKVPEEMGLTWALGLTIEKLFEAAMGEAILETIRTKKRPNQPDWPIVRTMLKQHLATPDFLKERLAAAGYPDTTIASLMHLADVALPVGDIQQAFLHGLLTPVETLDDIKQLGFSNKQAGILQKLYIDKAETEASRVYVSTARQLFRAQLITESDYRAILAKLNYPSMQIADDIAAILLEQSTGRLQNSVQTIKSRWAHGVDDTPAAVKELHLLGYGDAQANELIASWGLGPIPRQHGLSQAKILSFLVSGILTPDQATAKLRATGLDDADITLLLAHPQAAPHVRVRPLTPSLVMSAFLDGAIAQGDIPGLLTKAGVPDDQLAYYETIAKYRKARQRAPGSGTAPLSHGEIVDAWHYGLMQEPDAITALEQLGYSPDNALLLLEIKNKGPIQAASAPLFSTLQGAIQFLESLGFTIYGQIDPRIAAAEAMLTQAGLSFQGPVINPPVYYAPPVQITPPIIPTGFAALVNQLTAGGATVTAVPGGIQVLFPTHP